VKHEADHLREVGERGFPSIALPIGVGRETDGSVEREVRAYRPEALGVQRKEMLEPENGIGEQ